jgi:hypothetical protein
MMRRRLWVRGGAAVLTASVLMGCGGSDEGAFDSEVAEVRAAVESGDHQAASEALDALATRALAARDAGTVSEGELAELSQLIESSRALLDQVVPTSTTTTTTTSTTEPPPPSTEPEDDDDEDDKDDDDKKKGKGQDKDD